MFPFKKKNDASGVSPKRETSHEQVRRVLDETSDKLGEAVRKMEERFAQRQLQPIRVKK